MLEQRKPFMMRRRQLYWLIVKILFTGILLMGFVYYGRQICELTGNCHSKTPHVKVEIETPEVIIKKPVVSSNVAIGEMTIEELRANYFISVANYKHRLSPKYFNDPNITMWQRDTYQFAAELGKRYGCQYFIDIGCGSAYKTAMVQNEFKTIAVDYGFNFLKSKKKYPNIQFISLDLGKSGCTLELSSSILRQSIVVSADVIEHIPNPFACYLPLMSNLTKYAKAVVVSTPDRLKLYNNKTSWQPNNPSHVREWTLAEFEAMLADSNLIPIISGWECRNEKCGGGFSWETSPYTTNVVSLVSSETRDAWKQDHDTGLTVFILVHPQTKPSLYNEVIEYYRSQTMDTIVFSREPLKLDTPEQSVITIERINDVISEINNQRHKKDADHWFLFVDGHEIVQPPNRRLRQWNLFECVNAINRESDGFNAIPLTILFPMSNATESNIPFKMFVPGPWNTKDGAIVQTGFDTLLDRVRIWKNSVGKATPVTVKTKMGETIKDFTIDDRKIYPYNFISIRFQPDKADHVTDVFDEKMERIYAVDAAISHVTTKRQQIIQRDYIY